MKESSKNWIWLVITILSLIIFLFASLVLGLKFFNHESVDLQSLIASDSGTRKWYDDATIGLVISGLVVSGLAILFVLGKNIADISNIKIQQDFNFWDYIYFGLISLASLLIIIGFAIYLGGILNEPFTTVKSDVGSNVLFFIILLLPIIFGILVLSIDWYKKRKTKKK